jgi:hypothetical protein
LEGRKDNRKPGGSGSLALTGAAGVHWVVAELCRQGYIALPTTRNMKGFDVIVVSADERRHAAIQVKSASKEVTFWPLGGKPPHFMPEATNLYAFVLYDSTRQEWDCYIVPGKVVLGQAQAEQDEKKKTGRKESWWSWYRTRHNNQQCLNNWDILRAKLQ